MRRSLALLVVLAACSSAPKTESAASRTEDAAPPSSDLLDACAKHLELLHRVRLSRELARDGLDKLFGPAPSAADLAASTKRLRDLGLKGEDDAFSAASLFARLAQPTVARGGESFLGWTPDLDDVGLAKIRARRPGQWKSLWGKPVEYEVILLDGFVVPDYPRFRETVLEHKESARDVPRRRGSLVVIDAKGAAEDRKRALADKKPGSAALDKMSEEDLLHELELREAAYLRFQDEVAAASVLDELATWLEVQEGSPDLALAGGVVSAGDGPDELRRAGAVQAIVVKLAASDTKEERAEVLTLPVEERRKRLKELAPHFIRGELGH